MTAAETTYIPLDECKHGVVYRIYSRNLTHGVFHNVTQGFIGIREKMGDVFLFSEYHWDTGPPFGTARPLEELGPLPEGIAVAERLGSSWCSACERDIRLDEGADPEIVRYRRRHIEDESPLCDGATPYAPRENKALFDYLDALEKQ
jgi:hypothetical protein